MYRAATRRWLAERSSHAGTQSGRGDSSVWPGRIPSASWRAWMRSRSTSQPWSKAPRNRSSHDGGA